MTFPSFKSLLKFSGNYLIWFCFVRRFRLCFWLSEEISHSIFCSRSWFFLWLLLPLSLPLFITPISLCSILSILPFFSPNHPSFLFISLCFFLVLSRPISSLIFHSRLLALSLLVLSLLWLHLRIVSSSLFSKSSPTCTFSRFLRDLFSRVFLLSYCLLQMSSFLRTFRVLAPFFHLWSILHRSLILLSPVFAVQFYLVSHPLHFPLLPKYAAELPLLRFFEYLISSSFLQTLSAIYSHTQCRSSSWFCPCTSHSFLRSLDIYVLHHFPPSVSAFSCSVILFSPPTSSSSLLSSSHGLCPRHFVFFCFRPLRIHFASFFTSLLRSSSCSSYVQLFCVCIPLQGC